MRKYFRHSIKDTVLIKKILAIDFFDWGAEYTPKEEIHSFWEFSTVEKGEVAYYIEGKTYNLKKGDMFFMKPGQRHFIKAQNNRDAKLFFLCFECLSPALDALSNFSKQADENESRFISHIQSEALDTFKTSSFEKLTPLDNPRLGGEQCLQLYLELFIIELLRSQSENSNPTIFFRAENSVGFICEQVMELLKNHVYDKLSIDEICKSINYSRSYISHMFKKYYGKSVIACFNELKIEEAKKLIRQNELNFSQISEKLNFSDFHLFNYTFKKHTGTSPSAYKNSYFEQIARKKE